jgi:hypothetical protein
MLEGSGRAVILNLRACCGYGQEGSGLNLRACMRSSEGGTCSPRTWNVKFCENCTVARDVSIMSMEAVYNKNINDYH